MRGRYARRRLAGVLLFGLCARDARRVSVSRNTRCVPVAGRFDVAVGAATVTAVPVIETGGDRSGISPRLIPCALVTMRLRAAWRRPRSTARPGQDARGDAVGQHLPRPHRGELIDVADEADGQLKLRE